MIQKYLLGQTVWYTQSSFWVGLESAHEVEVESGVIKGITLRKDGTIYYYTGSFIYRQGDLHPELIDGYYFAEKEIFTTKNAAINALINKLTNLKDT